MQPVLLKFKGFYSYTEEEEIDFTILNKARLFGIFGKTGSGKSAILDAICYSFFGKIDRHMDNETKAFINVYTNEGYVDFTFKVKKYGFVKEYTSYRIVRKFVLTNKKSKEVDIDIALYDEFENVLSTKIKECNSLISEILSIKDEDFSKIVCLPQGKFSKFLHDTPSNRTNFLLKIFNIEKYEVKDELKNSISIAKNKIEVYEKDIVRTLSFGFEDEEIKIQDYNILVKTLEKQKKEYEDSLIIFEKDIKKLSGEKDIFQKKKEEYDSIIKAFDELDALKIKQKIYEDEIKKFNETYEMALISKKINYTLPYFNIFKKNGALLNSTKESIKKLNSELEILLEKIKDYDNFEEKAEIEEKKIQTLISNRVQLNTLIEENEKEQYLKTISLQKDLCKKKKAILSKAKEDYKKIITEKERIFNEINILNDKIILNEKNYKLLEDRETLGAFLIKLEEEGVCPLCGSENHPNKVKIILENEFQNNKDEKVILLKDKKLKEESLIDFIKTIRKTDIVYNENNFEGALNTKITDFWQKILESESDLETNFSILNLKEESFKNFNKKVQKIANNVDLYEHFNEISTTIINMQKDLKERKIKYTSLKEDISKNKNLIINKNEILSGQEDEFLKSEKEYLELISKYKFDDFEKEKENAFTFDEIEKIETKNSEIMEKISNNKALILEKEKVTEKIDIQNIKNEKNVNIEKLSSIDEFLKKTISESASFNEKISKINYIFNTLSKEYDNYLDCKNELLDFETLDKIVGKKKLVNYLISLKTKNLIDNANTYLSKITKDKFQLICNDTLEFQVCERSLNNNYIRNIKSLSGGETFIFSLCLSLALSKELQKNIDSKFEFFFIDEGFGTLDEDKLEKIYETLSILSETMTIGFITHIPYMKNFVQHKILVGENLDGDEIFVGKKISII
ncbi:MAG: SbcC/MukB-like Walker B domain-containing protein [Lachnospirales bacterium]